ncbi:unnamed protein product [Effrenium voratum]|uniref:Uncharacterized protein n=1 Tax=Effrenium voratum TaxID=2562239 RepID=A0AA36HMF2_9DINO|nr:unnamed protein product [Effrenium voratum]
MPGGVLLRPYHLAFRCDFGFAGTIDPDETELLVSLILSEGFRTNPDLIGVEKLAVVAPDKALLESPYKPLPRLPSAGQALIDAGDALPPFSVAFVKGWRRSVCALIVAEGVRTLDLLEAVSDDYKASMSTIYGSVGRYGSVRDQVFANRGVTLASSSTRRAPNCFNFLRQAEVLERSGAASDFTEEWDTASKVAKAFQLGRTEANAVSSLRSKVAVENLQLLRDSVDVRGMRGFLTNEVVAKDVFATGWTSGFGPLEQWQAELTNDPDGFVVHLLIQRLCVDWDKQAPSMRSAWTFRATLPVHQACGLFLHFLFLLQSRVPEEVQVQSKGRLRELFLQGYMDAEIEHVLVNTVPPGDLRNITAFRDVTSKHENQVSEEAEKRDRELARRVAEATLAQIKSKLQADIVVLKSRLPTRETDARETALDVLYQQQRQRPLILLIK